MRTIPRQNWNEIWESNYSPVQIGKKCHIRAPFHLPPKGVQYDVIISPKMSFGTAHHETTRLVMEFMLTGEWKREKVMDFGCGTGILAILARKMGAGKIIALDKDPWALENARENFELNDCSKIEVCQGEISSVGEDSFDIILANINLDVLLKEMKEISRHLKNGGISVLSGFCRDDLDALNNSASGEGLSLITKETLNNWTVGVYRKAD
jgi:ribosomal protein L11 methyltransferase